MSSGTRAPHRLRTAATVGVALLAGVVGPACSAGRSGSDDGAPPSTRPSSTTSAPSSTTTTAASPPTEAPTTVPAFQSSISSISVEALGASWNPDIPACARPEDLRLLTVTHWGYDGAEHEGRIVVHERHADAVVEVFRKIHEARFPIERMVPISEYGGDDGASMRANNTSGFNCRFVAGTTRVSEHALGQAIDVNPLHNPYVRGGSIDPPEGARWADRTLGEPGMILPDDPVVRAFAEAGWAWGGAWRTGQDHQHFSAGGR